MTPRHASTWLIAVVLAGACATALHTRVYTDFERVRLRVVTAAEAASPAGRVVATLPDLGRLVGQPTALVVRLANASGTPRVIRITAGGAVLRERAVPPTERDVRVDLSVSDGAELADAGRVEFAAPAGGWTLNYLEVANVHGYSSGLFEFMITPSSARTPRRLGALASGLAFVLLTALYGLCWCRIAHRRGRRAYAALAVLVASFLVAVLAAPFVSDFAIYLAPHTLLVCLAVLYYPAMAVVARTRVWPPLKRVWPPLKRGARWVWVTVPLSVQGTGVSLGRAVKRGTAAAWAKRNHVIYVAAVVVFVSSIAKWYEPDTGLTALIKFGDRIDHQRLASLGDVPLRVYANSVGYDGQYYAQLAVDPLVRDPAFSVALDAPAYRARRILFSWTAYVAGLGRPGWIVHAYAVQYVVLWILLAWVLCRWFPPTSVQNLALWLACLFSEGLILSVLSAVPDGPGMLLLALGVAAMERGRPTRAAAVVGIACLAKSTNVLWSAMVVGPEDVRRRNWQGVVLRGLLVAAPLTAWMLYLVLGTPLGGASELVAGSRGISNNFAVPFSGYAAKWGATVAELRDAGWDSYARFSLLALIGLTTQAVVLLAVRDWRNPWWRAGMGSVVLMAFLGPAVWEGYPGAVTRVLLPMVFAFNAVLPRDTRWFWPLFVLGNLALLHSLEALRLPFWRYI